MKVAIVNCFDTYESRIDLIKESFVSKGHEVVVIQSDFKHFQKVHRFDNKKDFILIKTKAYYKNMSLVRLISHYNYAKNAFKYVKEFDPDLLYVTVPPNSLVKFAAQYKKENKNVKLIFDLIDLWPETMPMGLVKDLPPFTFWKSLRDKSLKHADFVITECNLYQKILLEVLKDIRTDTLYLAKRDVEVKSIPMLSNEEIQLCYLGSINNIIDIPKIKAIINSLNKIKPVILHIIGDGESKESLISEVKQTGSKVLYHGNVYDDQEKQNIFDKCQLGLNIMKDNVCVGLTMKSIDYLQHGLPIINNIKGDTTEIVEKYNVGINVTDYNYDEMAFKIKSLNKENQMKMRENSRFLFDELFSKRAFENKLNEVLQKIDIY